MSCVAVVRKARIGFVSNLRTIVGNSCPPRKATQLPLAAYTRLKAFGRLHAAVNAAMPPLLPPDMQRSLPLVERLSRYSWAMNGSSSSIRNRTLRSLTPSYSKSRLRRPRVPDIGAGRSPGRTKTPIVTGISFVAIIVSMSVFSRGLKPSVFT